ncbi:unnamed protein product [Heterobilharzia americana]|nr:unnamed protein product [Heterobilharzia americana]
MKVLDKARLYNAVYKYQISVLTDEEYSRKSELNFDSNFVTEPINLCSDEQLYDQNVLFVVNSKQSSDKAIYQNLFEYAIKLYNEVLELIIPYNKSLQEILIRFELLTFCLEESYTSSFQDFGYFIDQKCTVENFDILGTYYGKDNNPNDDKEINMQSPCAGIIQKFGVTGVLIGGLVMGLLSKRHFASEDQYCRSRILSAILLKSILHASLPCAICNFDYCYKYISTDSLEILKLETVFSEHCLSSSLAIKVMNETINHLISYEKYIEALPVIYLLSYISKNLSQDLKLEIKSKLLRIKCLIGVGALKQALIETCAILQEQTVANYAQDCEIALINFDDAKTQENLNTLLMHKLSNETIHKWGSLLFCEVQLVRAQVCYEIAQTIPYFPKKYLMNESLTTCRIFFEAEDSRFRYSICTLIRNSHHLKLIISNISYLNLVELLNVHSTFFTGKSSIKTLTSVTSPNPDGNQVAKSSGRKTKNQDPKKFIHLIYEADIEDLKNHSNFQSYLKSLLFICACDICQILINGIHDNSLLCTEYFLIVVCCEASILFAKVLRSQHQARSGSMVIAIILRWIQKLFKPLENTAACKNLYYTTNLFRKMPSEEEVNKLWFRCRAELARCQICEVDAERLLKELPKTENIQIPDENDNLKSALEEVEQEKYWRQWNEFILLKSQLISIRRKTINKEITNIMLGDFSLSHNMDIFVFMEFFVKAI